MAEQAANAQQGQGQFQLQRIYIKDLSFESPRAPEVFRQEWKPEVNLEVNHSATKIEGDIHEVFFEDVMVPASAMLGEEGNAWDIVRKALSL